MKVTNLVLAAMLMVSTGAFAQSALLTEAGSTKLTQMMTGSKSGAELTGLLKTLTGSTQGGAQALIAVLNKNASNEKVANLITALNTNTVNPSHVKAVALAYEAMPENQRKNQQADGGVVLGRDTDNRSRPSNGNVDSTESANNGTREDASPRVCNADGKSTSVLATSCLKGELSPAAEANLLDIEKGAEVEYAQLGGKGAFRNSLQDAKSKAIGTIAAVKSTAKKFGESCQAAAKRIGELASSACGIATVDQAALASACK